MKKNDLLATKVLAVLSAALLVLSQVIWFMPLKTDAETAGDELVVRVQYYGELGDKIREKARFSRSELESLGAEVWYYSNITRVGTVMTMAAYGPEVMTVIEAAGIDPGSIRNVTFRTTDGYTRNFTVEKHLEATKYYYPYLSSLYERNEDGDALTPLEGALDDMSVVPAILALEFGESKKPGVYAEDLTMKTDRTYRFCMGQGELTEGQMTNPDDGGGDITSMESCHSIYGIDVTLAGSPISGLSLDLDDTDLKVGSVKRISAFFTVDEAFEGAFSAEDLVWSSSDPSIATVNDSGEVRILKGGTVTITATAPDGTTAEIVINAPPDEKEDDNQKDDTKSEKDPEDNPHEEEDDNNISSVDTSEDNDDNNKDKNDKVKDEVKDTNTEQKMTQSGNQVTFTAREIKIGDIIVEEASPQDEMRKSMADDAEALTEAQTYSKEAAAGAAAGTGLLCGAGALSRIILYRREFGSKI